MLGVLVNRCCCLVCGLRRRLPVPPTSQHHRHRLSLAAEPEHPAGAALCACAFATFIEMGKLPFDLRKPSRSCRKVRSLSIAAAALRHEMGHQPETAGGVADVRRVFIPWGQMETFTVGGLLLAL